MIIDVGVGIGLFCSHFSGDLMFLFWGQFLGPNFFSLSPSRHNYSRSSMFYSVFRN